MRWWGWWRDRDEDRDGGEAARRERDAARRRLEADRRRRPEVQAAADRFAEMIEQALRGGPAR